MTVSLAGAADATISFDSQVKPIFETRCVKCHGPKLQMGKLDMRTRAAALKGGDHGPAFVEKNPELSRLYRHVSGLEKPLMPMDGKLSAAEVAILKSWIEQGAPWEGELKEIQAAKKEPGPEERRISPEARNFWSFQPPLKTAPPVIGEKHPVDAFLFSQLNKFGLKRAPEADRGMLVRRAYLDLTGLPPTPAEVNEFVRDTSPDAWEKLIDRLLASPRYGERWGRHWLDVARYADSNGYEHDRDRPNAWRYRDYVIQSFNDDTPYDQFLIEQFAGDEMEPTTDRSLIATAFLRNYAKVDFREKDNPQYRFDYLDDMIATIGRGTLGLTVQCAKCHDHKFDPIPQRDYYALQASIWGYVEVNHPLVPKEEADAYNAKVKAIDDAAKPLRDEIKELEEPYRQTILEKKYRKWPQNIQDAVFTPEDKRTPGQVLLANQIIRTTNVTSAEIDAALKPAELERKKALSAQIALIEKDRPKPIPVAMGITDGDYRFTPDSHGDEPAPGKGIKRDAIEGSFLNDGSKPYVAPPSWFLLAGDMYSRGAEMQPGFVQVASTGNEPTALPPSHHRTSGRRMALAKWLGSRENPLTPRVMANRIWHHHMGRGIVTSLDNFGKTGDRPTHPELLDWLAVEFVEPSYLAAGEAQPRPWSFKHMHRVIMTSKAYRMSAGFADQTNTLKDPDNLQWWRYRATRLEAETLRDAILAVSGSLNHKMFGPAVFPPLPQSTLASMKYGIWNEQADGPDVWRRSVYVYRKRGLPFPFFEVFDLPDQNLTCGRRNVSTVATQALTLMNNEFVNTHAAHLADRIASEAGADRARQVETAYQITLSRLPSTEERAAAVAFLEQNKLSDFAHVLLNLNEFVYLR
jgi:hypothetical protein